MNTPLLDELETTIEVLKAKRMPLPPVLDVPLNYAQFVGAELNVLDIKTLDEIMIKRGGATVITLRAL
jgi:hypothetical protein